MLPRLDSPVTIRAMSHRPRHRKNESSTDFCSKLSKKIAGA